MAPSRQRVSASSYPIHVHARSCEPVPAPSRVHKRQLRASTRPASGRRAQLRVRPGFPASLPANDVDAAPLPAPRVPVDAASRGEHQQACEPPERVDHATAALLGAVAGSVDAAGWIALAGLLPSHLTASLVMIGASGGRDSAQVSARLAMVPVFVLTVALVKALARWLHARNLPVLQPLLTLLTGSLTVFCVVGALTDSLLAEDPCALLGVGGIGVASMAVQNTIMRLCLAKHSPTTVMTGNLTQFVMAGVDLLSTSTPDHTALTRLRSAGMPLLGFVLGSVACGWLASRHGLLSLSLPVALSAYAAGRSWRALKPQAARSRQDATSPATLLFSVDPLRAGG